MTYDPKTEPGTLTLHIRTDGAAFHDPDDGAWHPWPELATILAHVAHRIERGDFGTLDLSTTIHDSNGNAVGRFRITSPEEVTK